jgi:hypothetical protein
VSDPTKQFSAVGGVWQESYWAKSVLELGIGGLVLVVIIFASILGRGLRVHRRLRDPGLRAVSAAILGLMVWAIAYNVKAQYLDFDPLNVYFWLFTGVLFKLAVLDREEARAAPARPAALGLDRELTGGPTGDRAANPPLPGRRRAYARQGTRR